MARSYGFGQEPDKTLAPDLMFLASEPDTRQRRRPQQGLLRRVAGGNMIEDVSFLKAHNAVWDEIKRVQEIFENPDADPKDADPKDAYPILELLQIKDKMKPNKVYYSIRFFERLKPENGQALTHPFYRDDYTKDEYSRVVEKSTGENVRTNAPIGDPIQNAMVMTSEMTTPKNQKLTVYPLDARYASYPYSNEIYNPFQTPRPVEAMTQRMIEDELFRRFLKEYEVLFDPKSPQVADINDLKAVKRQLNRFDGIFEEETREIQREEEKITHVGMLLNLFVEFLNRDNSFTTSITTLDLIDTLLDPDSPPQESRLTVDKLPTAGYLLRVNGLHKAFLFTKLYVDKEISQSLSRNIHALPSILMKGRKPNEKTQKDVFSWIGTYGKLHPEQMRWYRTKALVLNFDHKQPYDRSMIVINPSKVKLEEEDGYINISIFLVKQAFGSVFFYLDRESNIYYECDLSLVISTDVNEALTGLLTDAQLMFKYLDLAQMQMVTEASNVFHANKVFLETWSQMQIPVSQYRVLEGALEVLKKIEEIWDANIDSISFSEAVYRTTTDPERTKFIRALPETRMFETSYREEIGDHIRKFHEYAAKHDIPTDRVNKLTRVMIDAQASKYVFMASMLSGIAHQLLSSMRALKSAPASTSLLGMRLNILTTLIAYSEKRVVPSNGKAIKVFVSAQKRDDDVMNKAIVSTIRSLPSAVGLDTLFTAEKLYLFQNRVGVNYLTKVIYVTKAMGVVKQIYEISIDSQRHLAAQDAHLVASLANQQFGYEATITIVKPVLDERKRNYLFVGFGTMATNEIQVYEETALLDLFAKREQAKNPISIQSSKDLREMVITGNPKLVMFPESIYSVELSPTETEIQQEKTKYEIRRILQEQMGVRSSYLAEN